MFKVYLQHLFLEIRKKLVFMEFNNLEPAYKRGG